MVKELDSSGTVIGQYIARYYIPVKGADYMWDELAAAAWIDPTLITKKEVRYMSVDIDHGAGYGNTITWSEQDKAHVGGQRVEVQVDLDKEKFYRMFIGLMTGPTPAAR